MQSSVQNAESAKPINTNPKYIQFDMYYRDGDGFTESGTFLLENDLHLTVDQIRDWNRDHLQYSHILPAKYGLPTLAPIHYEHEECGEYDGPFMNISSLDFVFTEEELSSHDQPFSVVFNAMIDNKGVEGWEADQVKHKLLYGVERICEGLALICDASDGQLLTEEQLHFVTQKVVEVLDNPDQTV